MKLHRPSLTLGTLLVALVLEWGLRHWTASSGVIASVLSAQTAGLHWNVVVAAVFIACRLFVLLLLPALLVTWLVARFWKPR